MKEENGSFAFSAEEIDNILFKLYMLESKISQWNNDRREIRVSNRTEAYNLLSEIIAKIQNKI